VPNNAEPKGPTGETEKAICKRGPLDSALRGTGLERGDSDLEKERERLNNCMRTTNIRIIAGQDGLLEGRFCPREDSPVAPVGDYASQSISENDGPQNEGYYNNGARSE